MSTYDLVVRGGQVIDGTGSAAQGADVGVRDGRIVEVGDLDGSAGQVIDADGLVVAPGIVDIHTHFDAQVFWDPACSPSSLHGVTTVASGNCGFTIAPIEDSEIDYLTRMLSHVEGIPLDALSAGVDFGWRSFGEYLDRIDGATAVNFGALAGHSAIRRVVMGDDAVGGTATDDQRKAMGDLLRASIEGGALGFSSSWGTTHHDGDGNPVPSRSAGREELIDLARVVGELPGTTLEFLPGIVPFADDTMDVMADMALAADRTLNWNVLLAVKESEDLLRNTLAQHERAWSRGAAVVPLSYPAITQTNLNFRGGFAWDAIPGWSKTMALADDEKKRALADPAERARLAAAARSPEAGILTTTIAQWETLTVVRTFTPQTERFEGRVVGDVASELGVDPFDCVVDMALQDSLRTVFRMRLRGDDDESWELKRELWRAGTTVLGASDAGAHVDTIVTFNYATNMLAECRDRDLVPIEEVIHLLTDVQASLYGLRGRGRVAPGYFADLFVFDPASVGSGPVYWRDDLPAGAGRLYADAEGVAHVFVNGTEIVRGSGLTGATPGTVLRSGRDTESVRGWHFGSRPVGAPTPRAARR